LDIRPVSYPELEERIKKMRARASAVSAAAKEAAEYLAGPDVKLLTDRKHVENAFLLRRVFLDLMQEHSAKAITIVNCMTVIMPIAETSACLVLSTLNDENYQAFCEGDFAAIPAGMLINQITRTPFFMQDLTWANHGKVVVAHCLSARKMDGKNLEPAEIPTHYESDFGAAVKVMFRKGQLVTMVCPDRSSPQNYLGFKGTITGSPAHDICRSQCEIAVDGDWKKLLRPHSGAHWMMAYGDCLKEFGYAIRRLGLAWEDISSPSGSLI
jgi:L-fucose isomerase-like protein